MYAALAWRVGEHFDLLPFSVFVVSGAMLSLIDLVDQRLPSVILYPATTLVGLLLAASTVLHPSTPGFVRALAGMALLAAFYLVLAFLSGGGLGAGDVKLGALLGLTLGWVSWSALITATFFGWLAAALAWLLLRATGRAPADYLLPMGPYLILGAFLAIIMPPT
ncbi:prepilin peptidase [Gandjariella thermophila]|uniref:prepilin peptidase n=1 Tax=Gandjariella thermophila TaxID=1931992 RepID=UPI001CEF58A2|nr:prepilin peptidase [Gandjariella thermophila]